MPTLCFTPAIARHVPCPPMDVPDVATVRELIDRYFAVHPLVRAYVLDEAGALRHHVVVFVDGVMLRDRARLGERVGPGAEVFVMQALSGG